MCKIIFYDISLHAKAYDEILESLVGVYLDDVPDDRLGTDPEHGFGNEFGVITQPGSPSACKDDDLHKDNFA